MAFSIKRFSIDKSLMISQKFPNNYMGELELLAINFKI